QAQLRQAKGLVPGLLVLPAEPLRRVAGRLRTAEGPACRRAICPEQRRSGVDQAPTTMRGPEQTRSPRSSSESPAFQFHSQTAQASHADESYRTFRNSELFRDLFVRNSWHLEEEHPNKLLAASRDFAHCLVQSLPAREVMKNRVRSLRGHRTAVSHRLEIE